MSKLLIIAILYILAVTCECSNPSIKPIEPFELQKDVTNLCNAVRNSSIVYNDRIIEILTGRTNMQRQEIMKIFGDNCLHKTFLKEFEYYYTKKNTTLTKGLFYNIINVLVTPLDVYYGNEIRREKSTEVISSNAILDILTTSTDEELENIKKSYKDIKKDVKYVYRTKNRSPEIDFASEFFDSKRSKCQKALKKNEVLNSTQLANWFHEVGDLKTAINRPAEDEVKAIKLFRYCSFDELREAMKQYEEMYHQNLENAFIKRGFGYDISTGVVTMIRVVRSTPLYFAERLYDSLRGSTGTDTNALTRIIVGRSEIDLADISALFEQKYGMSLVSFIASKNEEKLYLDTLVAIVSGNQNSIK